jgi:hypothetical protein
MTRMYVVKFENGTYAVAKGLIFRKFLTDTYKWTGDRRGARIAYSIPEVYALLYNAADNNTEPRDRGKRLPDCCR